ncbi:MAG: PIN domain-containing protein [Deltaproteobacteria bacterium]|nr:PIN domain-containing protein [Deltaproteobacteria bacterium]
MNADRLFLDANILFSVSYGSPALEVLWELAQKKLCVLLASGYVIEEAKRNLHKADHLERLENFLSKVRIVPEVDPGIACPIDLPDKDKPVIMSAISARANYLITGDISHFQEYFGLSIMGVKICLPRDYILSRKGS